MSSATVPLKDIATREVTCLSVRETLGEAANLMAQRRFSSIVVVDDERHPVGIITERNILKAMRDGLPLQNSLSEGMSAPVITMHGDVDSLEAYETCTRAGIRHLVLVDDNGVVDGVVSETDFRLHLSLTALAGRRKISSIAKQSAIALPPDCALTQAVDLMHAQRKSCVTVIEQERPIGIVTERDMVRLYSSDESHLGLTLGKVMKSPVLTIPRDATTNHAAEMMLAHKVRHLVAVDGDGRMTGLVSEHDMTQAMIGGLAEERAGIEENILRALFDTLPDLVWLKDEQGVYLACNRRFEIFFGARESDIVGKTDYDFVARDQADSFRENDRRAIAIGKPSVNEEWLTFAEDGYRGLFEAVKTPMYNKRGKLIGVLGVARDITERERVKHTLAESEREFRTLAENLPDNIIRYDRDCRVHYMNPSMVRTINSELLPEVGKLPVAATPDSPLIRDLQSMVERVMVSGERVETEFEIKHPDGSLHWHHVIFVPELNKEGEVVGALGIGRDINERKRGEENLRVTASVFDTTQEAIVITNADNCIIDVNHAFTIITGYARDEVLGRDPRLLSSGRQDKAFYESMWKSLEEKRAWRGEIWNRRKEGELFAELLSISVICDDAGRVQRYVGVFSDITYFKAHEEELSQVANYDALTGIPNRRLLADRLGQAIAHAQRVGKLLAVCYLDLDGFKEVNDRYGHQTGDELLVDITRRLQDELRAGDTLARLGGDEFIMLFNDLAHVGECTQVLERLMQTIATPVLLGEHLVGVSASIGVAFYPEHGEDGDTLLRCADQAMYIAKQNGKNRFHCHTQN